ncbi:hypothetical protein [Aliiglaciecola sp. NS0011-25]|uniref:hypothetical protein n=1 Tax=Aliiglaciecola sp. NS0011-25 TaxID=3127654 RepID=UPI00334045DC
MFFTLFGIFVSLMMWALDKVTLPAHVDSSFLLGLVFDHIPFLTIGSLFIVVSFLVFLSLIFKKCSIKSCLRNQLQHISNRISQLSSPAIFVVIGFSIPVIGKYFTTGNCVYLSYFITFLGFAFAIYLMAKLAKEASHLIDEIQEKFPPKLALCISLATLLVWAAVTDLKPKKVEVEFDINVYQKIEEKAKKQNKTVKEFIEHSALSGLNGSN